MHPAPRGSIHSALGVSVGLVTESVEYEPYGYSVFSQYLKR